LLCKLQFVSMLYIVFLVQFLSSVVSRSHTTTRQLIAVLAKTADSGLIVIPA
jgi:hypothetical protein